MTADNTAYTLRVDTLALRDIAFGNVVYAGTEVCPYNNDDNSVDGCRNCRGDS